MADLTVPHVTAVAGLLTAAGYPLYVAEVTDDGAELVYPYLVLWPNPGTAQLSNLAGGYGQHLWVWQVTAVGRDWAETATALDRARAALVGQRLFVTGRDYGLVGERVTDQPIREDEANRDPNTGRPCMYGVAQFEVLSA